MFSSNAAGFHNFSLRKIIATRFTFFIHGCMGAILFSSLVIFMFLWMFLTKNQDST
jgi:hypothetical protein